MQDRKPHIQGPSGRRGSKVTMRDWKQASVAGARRAKLNTMEMRLGRSKRSQTVDSFDDPVTQFWCHCKTIKEF